MLPSTNSVTAIECNIENYGKQFPKQDYMSEFAIIENPQLQQLLSTVKISKSVMNFSGSDLPTKLGHNTEKLVELWQRKVKDLKPPQFNGKQVCLSFSKKNDHPNKLKLIPSDYVSVSIARSKLQELKSETVRNFYNTGVIICFQTKDNKWIYTEKNGRLLFPGGFIFGDKTQIKDEDISEELDLIRTQEKSLTNLLIDTAIKETKEEILNTNIEPSDCKILCGIGEDFIYPSKTSENHLKTVHCLKSIGILVQSSLTSDELLHKRQQNKPVDHHELPKLLFMDINAQYDETMRDNFILEHKNFYEFLTTSSAKM